MCSNCYRKVVLCIVAILVHQAAAGQVLYVDRNHPSAGDSNSGSEVLPLLTIERAMALVQPGDHVYIKGSADPTAPEAVYDRSGKDGLPIRTAGTAGNKIVIEAYPGHTVVLLGNGTNNGLALDYASYHEIRGFTFRNFNKAAEGFSAKTNILIEDCEFTQTNETGLRLRNVTNFTMRGCHVHHCFESGISVRMGTNVLFDGVVSSHNDDGQGADGDGDGFHTYGGDNIVFIDCVAQGNSEDGFDLNCDGVLINCVSRDHTACNVKLWRRAEDGYAARSMTLINCVVSGAQETGIKVSEGAELHLYNSVVYGNGEEGVAFRSPSVVSTPVYSKIVNAIISNNGSYGVHVAGATVNVVDADHNLYYQNASGNYQLHSDTNAISGQDPLFFGASSGMFQLRAESPAVDAGTTIAAVQDCFASYPSRFTQGCAEDNDGDCRPFGVAWDIGIDERTAVAGNTPPAFVNAPSPPPYEWSVNEGQTLTLQFQASDPQGDALVFFLAGGNVVEGMTIDQNTGLFRFAPTYEQGGNTSTPSRTYDVVVGVTDDQFSEPVDQTTVRVVVYNVNRAPSYNGIGTYTLVEGRLWMYGLAFRESDGDTITYAASGLPAGMTIDGSDGVVVWTPTSDQVGSHTVEITASDGGDVVVQEITFEVLPTQPYIAPTEETKIFYVDAVNGDNANDGQTEETAWKTIRKAGLTLSSGQMVLIRSGTYNEEVNPNSGTAANPIVFRAYPGETPIMDGAGMSSPEAFQGGSHVVYDGLTFRNYGETIDFRGSTGDVVVINCVIESATDYGLFSFAGDRLRVENVQLRNIGDRGYYGTGTNVHLYNVTIETVADRGISALSVDNFTVASSDVSGCGRYGILMGGNSVLIQDTNIHDNAQLGAELDAKYNFFVSSTALSTALFGGGAANLVFGSNSSSRAWVTESVITGSARYGMRVGANTVAHVRSTVVSDNAQQDITVAIGGTLVYDDAFPADPTNYAPVFTAVGNRSVNEKSLLSVTVAATDVDGDTLTYSAVNLPTGANFNPATRTFAWTPTNVQSGSYVMAFRVSDGKAIASQLMAITVNDIANQAPVLATIGARSTRELESLSVPVSASDPDGDTLCYTVVSLPSGAAFSNQTLTWTPATGQAGSYAVTFQVSDGESSDSEKITLTVYGGTNHPPVLAAIGNKNVSENQTLSFTVSATDVDGNPLTYSVSGLPSGASFANRVFTWTPGFNQAGSYNVTFTISDGQAEDSETIAITVANVNRPPVLASIGGKQVDENFSLSFSTSATDPDGDSVTYSATGLPAGASFTGGVFTWVPSFTQAGSHSVTFVASDGSLTDTEQITITVGNVADETAPVVAGLSPAAGAVQTPINPLIALSISDGGRGVDANSVTIQLDGQLVYSGNQTEYQSDRGVCRRTGTKASYRYHFAPNGLFGREQEVSVRVTAKDLANNVMAPYVYRFVTEMQSFGQNCAINAGSLACAHPAIATDSQGNLWTVWDCGQAGEREIYVAKHQGQTVFAGAPVRLTNLAGDRCDPVVAVAPDDVVYVAWQDNRRGNWDIYVSRSSDGVTWQNAVCVTDSNDNQTRPAIAVDGANPPRVYIAYEDDGAGNQNICVTSSTTSFATKTTTQVTSHAANQTEPALAVGAGNVAYVVWTDARNGLTDIYGASSASWANVAFVTGSGDQHSPALAVEPGTSVLHLVWCDDAVGGSDVLHAGSTGLPGSPLAGTCIVDDTSNAGQSAPAIIAVRDSFDNTHVYVCWQDYRSAGDTADSDLYFAEIRSGVAGTNILVGDGGANSDQSEPALGFDPHGEPVILWTDDAGGTTRICGARATHFAPTAWASGLITRAAGGRVGPATVDSVEDVSLVLPANAYECDATFTISRMYNPQCFGPHCMAGCEIGPSGVEFSVPVTVTIPYDASGTGLAVPYWYDPQTGTLSQQGISQITTATGTNETPLVSFKTTHLTSFYVLDGDIRSSSGSGSSGGGGGCALSNSRDGDVLGYLLPYAAMALFVLVLRQKDRMRREL